jgi:hypothetical protein
MCTVCKIRNSRPEVVRDARRFDVRVTVQGGDTSPAKARSKVRSVMTLSMAFALAFAPRGATAFARRSCLRATPSLAGLSRLSLKGYKPTISYALSRYTSTAVDPTPKPTPALAPILTPTPRTWVDSLPPRVRPYLYLTRIDKPIGTLLLFYPCAWSITMAAYATHAPPWVPLGYTALFGLGALVMRGAGCTINDLWDRNLDKAVERTKERPLARGDITPTQAIGFLAVQLSAGLAVLTQLNWYR